MDAPGRELWRRRYLCLLDFIDEYNFKDTRPPRTWIIYKIHGAAAAAAAPCSRVQLCLFMRARLGGRWCECEASSAVLVVLVACVPNRWRLQKSKILFDEMKMPHRIIRTYSWLLFMYEREHATRRRDSRQKGCLFVRTFDFFFRNHHFICSRRILYTTKVIIFVSVSKKNIRGILCYSGTYGNNFLKNKSIILPTYIFVLFCK